MDTDHAQETALTASVEPVVAPPTDQAHQDAMDLDEVPWLYLFLSENSFSFFSEVFIVCTQICKPSEPVSTGPHEGTICSPIAEEKDTSACEAFEVPPAEINFDYKVTDSDYENEDEFNDAIAAAMTDRSVLGSAPATVTLTWKCKVFRSHFSLRRVELDGFNVQGLQSSDGASVSPNLSASRVTDAAAPSDKSPTPEERKHYLHPEEYKDYVAWKAQRARVSTYTSFVNSSVPDDCTEFALHKSEWFTGKLWLKNSFRAKCDAVFS